MGEQRIDQWVELDSGRLRIKVFRSGFPPQHLCGFATRDNPKRGYLVVSKVLGKHWPVAPSVMRGVREALVSRLELGAGPWLFIAMAETATGLGQGLFELVLERAPGARALFLHSTRYRIDGKPCLTFAEPHCHAPEHLLYEPDDPILSVHFHAARELILIDDEISTGTTLCNLAEAYRRINPRLRRVHWVSIADFSAPQAVPACSRRLGLPIRVVSVLRAELQFIPRVGFSGQAGASAVGDNRCRPDQLARHASGRLGVDARAAVPLAEVDRLADGLSAGARVLVLGTGEYMHPAYLLGQALEARGMNTRVASTTRSPIRLGADIARRLIFRDNYGEGIPNYLYNVDPATYDRIIVCHETPVADLADLIGQLGAACMTFAHPEAVSQALQPNDRRTI